MTVPVHNLYDFVHQVTKNKFLLLYFYPWGHKSIMDIRHHQISNDWINGPRGIRPEDRFLIDTKFELDPRILVDGFQPVILCHDQEPLNYDLYNQNSEFVKERNASQNKLELIDLDPNARNLNLRLAYSFSVQKTWILLHSELNSSELARYEATGNFCGAYWWSHAVIARDWYRYAEHDRSLAPDNNQRLFLTYSRDDSGNRGYRKTFRQLIETYQLQNQCQFTSVDNSVADSNSSAEYKAEDFNATAISVVLETVFDQRIHLTEKILRAIACGHPFILAAGPGSLRLLRSYGFLTFSSYIDESYDDISDPELRLNAIVKEMKRIAELPQAERNRLIETLRTIAAANQQRFFSTKFFQQVVDELKTNVDTAFNTHQGKLNFENWWKARKWKKQQLSLRNLPVQNSELTSVLVTMYRQQRLLQRTNREQ